MDSFRVGETGAEAPSDDAGVWVSEGALLVVMLVTVDDVAIVEMEVALRLASGRRLALESEWREGSDANWLR